MDVLKEVLTAVPIGLACNDSSDQDMFTAAVDFVVMF
jgi:hypothetical protein